MNTIEAMKKAAEVFPATDYVDPSAYRRDIEIQKRVAAALLEARADGYWQAAAMLRDYCIDQTDASYHPEAIDMELQAEALRRQAEEILRG